MKKVWIVVFAIFFCVAVPATAHHNDGISHQHATSMDDADKIGDFSEDVLMLRTRIANLRWISNDVQEKFHKSIEAKAWENQMQKDDVLESGWRYMEAVNILISNAEDTLEGDPHTVTFARIVVAQENIEKAGNALEDFSSIVSVSGIKDAIMKLI